MQGRRLVGTTTTQTRYDTLEKTSSGFESAEVTKTRKQNPSSTPAFVVTNEAARDHKTNIITKYNKLYPAETRTVCQLDKIHYQ